MRLLHWKICWGARLSTAIGEYRRACLREDATDPERSSLERLAMVRNRARRIREIRREPEAAK